MGIWRCSFNLTLQRSMQPVQLTRPPTKKYETKHNIPTPEGRQTHVVIAIVELDPGMPKAAYPLGTNLRVASLCHILVHRRVPPLSPEGARLASLSPLLLRVGLNSTSPLSQPPCCQPAIKPSHPDLHCLVARWSRVRGPFGFVCRSANCR